MIDWMRLDWQSVASDALTAALRRDQQAIMQLVVNFIGQIVSQWPQVAVVPVNELPLEDFKQELQNSVPIETKKVHFTSEGGFVME